MSAVRSSPLAALVGYYERLRADPSKGVAEFGFSEEKIHFTVVIERTGSLADAGLVDLRTPDARGKPIHKLMLVPDGGGRSGTALKPFFCWDNTGYTLGSDNKDKPARAKEMFAAFRDYHLAMRKEVGDDPGYAAVCRFLEKWNPTQAKSLPNWEEAAGKNVVFKLRGHEGYVHQSDAVMAAWRRRVEREVQAEGDALGMSLVSGEVEPLARLHPLISGVAGANTMGAAIVSFNLDAFESHGRIQSYNSPVGIRDAFRYTTALNKLLADRSRRVQVGDATVVFWTDRPEGVQFESEVAAFLGGQPVPDDAESVETVRRVRSSLGTAKKGEPGDDLADASVPFYILGLSPNASRLSVRYWMTGTVAQFRERLRQHADALEMIGARDDEPPLSIRRLLVETAREPKDIPPNLAGEFTSAILEGLPYPRAVFAAILRRIRADSGVNHARAAIIKAFMIRNLKQEVPVSLDKNHPNEAYHLGRLFAVLEKTQEDGSEGKLNSTIKDRYFSAASATPGSVFPRLLRLHQHHMRKLENPGLRISREKLMGEVFAQITGFPSHHTMDRQGFFDVGYYHQRQDMFTKKSDTQDDSTKETTRG